MSRPKPLPFDERLKTAAQLVLRARVFYELWWYLEGAETRPAIIDTMRQYSEFFRFDPHAHFVAFVVHVAALFEKRNDSINLPALAKELEAPQLISPEEAAEVRRLLDEAAPVAKKAIILRSNLFAHRSAMLSYAEAFRRAAVTPDELRNLTDIALEAANRLLRTRGFEGHFFSPAPVEDAEAMLRTLSEHRAQQ